MANIGLSNIWYSHLTEGTDGTPSYDGAIQFGKAVTASFAPNNNSAELFGDDTLQESDYSFQSATLTLGTTDDDDTVFADVLGHTVTDGVVKKTATDIAPYVGIGHIVTKMVGGVYKYKVEFFYKVKFSTPSSDNNTKGANTEFATGTIEGKISALADEDNSWSESKTFTTKSDALTYLKGLLGTGASL